MCVILIQQCSVNAKLYVNDISLISSIHCYNSNNGNYNDSADFGAARMADLLAKSSSYLSCFFILFKY